MIPLVAIRPEPGCSATVEAALNLGLEAHGFPMFEVRPVPWDAPGNDAFDALLLGSANALRHGGSALAGYSGMPAYCVGRKTAEAAEDAGLSVADIGSGGLQEVLDRVQVAHSRVLRLAGRKRTPLSIPDGIRMQEKVVYASEPLPMSGELARLLRSEAVVLLHSGEAARHFAETCPDACRAHVRLVAIGPRVAERAGDGWHSVRSACQPSEDALLALAEELCKDEGGSERGRPSN